MNLRDKDGFYVLDFLDSTAGKVYVPLSAEVAENSSSLEFSKAYVLAICNDTPYHEGMEYWWRGSLRSLLKVVWSNWDWINEREYTISLVTFGTTKHRKDFTGMIPENPAEMTELDREVSKIFKRIRRKIRENYGIYPTDAEIDRPEDQSLEEFQRWFDRGDFFNDLLESSKVKNAVVYPEPKEFYVCRGMCDMYFDTMPTNGCCLRCGDPVIDPSDF